MELASEGFSGLSEAEAAARLKRFGPNRFVRPSMSARVREVARTVADPMVLMLLGAAGFYAALGARHDAIVLAAAAVPVLIVDVLFESRARMALRRLASAVAPRTRVIRDGRQREIATAEVVPGDLLFVSEGDVVHADGVLRWGANLAADESHLTGEAEPQEKVTLDLGSDNGPGDASRLFAGSLVLSGHGYVEVTATGERTRYGNVARLVSETPDERTPLERKTARMARYLLILGLTAAVGIFGLMLARGNTLKRSFLYSVTLAISAAPEEYPLVMALFLSLGAWRLSRRGVLARRLSSIEALGSTTVICLDKTGTLTEGRYGLAHCEPVGEGTSIKELLEAAALACELNAADPIDQAILSHCREHGVDIDALHSRWKLTYDYPFEASGKHMSHVWVSSSVEEYPQKAWIVAKGSLEGILEHCVLAERERRAVEAAHAAMADQGMRVLAVAGRWSSESGAVRSSVRSDAFYAGVSAASNGRFTGQRSEDERGLKLYGLLAFCDPLRPGVARIVQECQQAGIKLKLVTGDHAITAHAVAEAAGIIHEDDKILSGQDLDRLEPAQLADLVNRASIFARVRPEQKYAIVDALVRAGEIVAMTGDGINDAPALRRANIGVTMGQRGTEIARAAAAIVLLKDEPGGLVAAIREGRQVFANIQRAFFFLAGFKAIVVGLALLAPALGMPILLQLVHLVWLELVVHPTAALVFEGEPPAGDVMREPPRAPAAPLLPLWPAMRAGLTGALVMAGALWLYAHRLSMGAAYARSAAMAVIIGGGLMLACAELFGARPWWEVRWPRRLRFWAVVAAVSASLPICMTFAPLASLMHMRPISAADWGYAALIVCIAVGWRAFGWGHSRARKPRRSKVS